MRKIIDKLRSPPVDSPRRGDGNIAREVGALVGWSGPFWARRYTAIVVSDEEAAQVERLRYILAHGVKENLVEKVLDWPGVHAARSILEAEPFLKSLEPVPGLVSAGPAVRESPATIAWQAVGFDSSVCVPVGVLTVAAGEVCLGRRSRLRDTESRRVNEPIAAGVRRELPV